MNNRYDLPKTEGSPRKRFEEFCELQPLEYIPSITSHVNDALTRLRSFDRSFLGPNLKLAEALVERCHLLLSKYAELPDEKKKLAIGAIRYFVVHMDHLPDTTPVVGLDDDVAVMNHVLERLGFIDACIPSL